MSENGHSSIKFSLEESVLFKSGQEVDELISISLDPNISIVEEEGFVMLRGSLNLTGEYKRIDSADSQEEAEEEASLKGRYVQVVEDRDDGYCEFFHQFPVDITIPEDRVHQSNEVFVEVESFDYVMPENSRLNIEAEVQVYGLQGDQQESQSEHLENKDPAPTYESDERDEDMADEESTVEVELEEYTEEEESEINVSHEYEQEYEEEDDEDEEEEEEGLYAPFAAEARSSGNSQQKPPQHDHHNPFPFPFPMLPEMDMDEVAHRLKGFFQKHSAESPSTSGVEPAPSSSVAEEVQEQESSTHESVEMEESPNEKPKKKKDKYHSMSFADFFARKDEEEPAKLKVRLVQHGDSLERLADTYGVTVQQILRANQMDPSQEVHEGQVLYIPGKTAYRK
ncbi:stage VI sporulation protein D [Siminovitchia fortis]|uniref:stage VI sporulation protein D n=1 Tax=Siminovitchia fortis TaxID=254758 RepID=UPI0013E3B42B|nr:stage VI sporulation protein D [Siminovitchia fortis]WHY82492.1 stage VI sporulation protein D [Siminovitchia fortis]